MPSPAVDVIEVDPLAADAEATLRALWEVGRAARADRPFDLAAPWPTAYVTWTSPRADQAAVFWAAREGGADGVVVGMAALSLSLLDNLHSGFTQFFVHPDHQRRGIGTALLEVVVERFRSAGRTALMAAPRSPVDHDGPGQLMLRAHGFEVAIAGTTKVADLEATQPRWPAMAAEAAAHHEGYRLVTWKDRVPGELMEGYCHLEEAFIDEAPMGDLDYQAEVWTPQRVRERDDLFAATGRRQLGVVAIAADGSAAGSTEMFVNDAAAWRALQGGTLVLPEHRGHRLGLALKLANHRAVRGRFPDCRYVFTDNAGVNAPMNAVNEALGFRDVDRTLEMQRRF